MTNQEDQIMMIPDGSQLPIEPIDFGKCGGCVFSKDNLDENGKPTKEWREPSKIGETVKNIQNFWEYANTFIETGGNFFIAKAREDETGIVPSWSTGLLSNNKEGNDIKTSIFNLDVDTYKDVLDTILVHFVGCQFLQWDEMHCIEFYLKRGKQGKMNIITTIWGSENLQAEEFFKEFDELIMKYHSENPPTIRSCTRSWPR